MKCKNCGYQNPNGAKFCGYCQHKMNNNAERNRFLIAGILFLIAGVIFCFTFLGSKEGFETEKAIPEAAVYTEYELDCVERNIHEDHASAGEDDIVKETLQPEDGFSTCSSLVKLAIDAYLNGDWDTLINHATEAAQFSSENLVYYEWDEINIENIPGLTDEKYVLSYEINQIKLWSAEEWWDRHTGTIYKICHYRQEDVWSAIEKIMTANVTFVIEQGENTFCTARTFTLSEENGTWKLFFIESDPNCRIPGHYSETISKTKGNETSDAINAYRSIIKRSAEQKELGLGGSFTVYWEDFDKDNEKELLINWANGINYEFSLYDFEDGILYIRYDMSFVEFMSADGGNVCIGYYQENPVFATVQRCVCDGGYKKTYVIYDAWTHEKIQILMIWEKDSDNKQYYVDGKEVKQREFDKTLAKYKGLSDDRYALNPVELFSSIK